MRSRSTARVRNGDRATLALAICRFEIQIYPPVRLPTALLAGSRFAMAARRLTSSPGLAMGVMRTGTVKSASLPAGNAARRSAARRCTPSKISTRLVGSMRMAPRLECGSMGKNSIGPRTPSRNVWGSAVSASAAKRSARSLMNRSSVGCSVSARARVRDSSVMRRTMPRDQVVAYWGRPAWVPRIPWNSTKDVRGMGRLPRPVDMEATVWTRVNTRFSLPRGHRRGWRVARGCVHILGPRRRIAPQYRWAVRDASRRGARVSMMVGMGRPDARARPQSMAVARSCRSPAESRSKGSGWPSLPVSVAAKLLGSTLSPRTRSVLCSRLRKDSSIRDSMRSVWRVTMRVRRRAKVSRTRARVLQHALLVIVLVAGVEVRQAETTEAFLDRGVLTQQGLPPLLQTRDLGALGRVGGAGLVECPLGCSDVFAGWGPEPVRRRCAPVVRRARRYGR